MTEAIRIVEVRERESDQDKDMGEGGEIERDKVQSLNRHKHCQVRYDSLSTFE